MASLYCLTVPEIFNRLSLPAHSSATSSPLCKLAIGADVLGSRNLVSPKTAAELAVLIANGDMYPRSDLMFTMHSAGKKVSFKYAAVIITTLNNLTRGNLLAHTSEPEIIYEIRCITAVVVKVQVFWDITQSRLVNRYQHFGGYCCLHLQDPGILRRIPCLSLSPTGSLFLSTFLI